MSLPETAPEAEPSLFPEGGIDSLRFAVVDLETRNVCAGPGAVIEVGIALMERGEITEEWGSLVRPSGPVGDWVSKLTGITDEMVAGAPAFAEIAPKVEEMLRGRIFVAHNVSFDWKMIRGEMPGLPARTPRLCTVRMGRALVPEAPRHSLDVLCAFLGIDLGRHHRALDDARAAAKILAALLKRDGAEKWTAAQLAKFRA